MMRILMVCMGNICRSPMAHSVGLHFAREAGLSRQIEFDSAGTHSAHFGGAPDPRARIALEARGYATVRHRARPLAPRDFERFDLILAMDRDNLLNALRACPVEHADKIRLFLDLAPGLEGQDVPDPYYGNAQGFERVLDLCEAGVRGVMASPLARLRP